ncbi:tyrosine-type recombinase/integrase [Kaistella carnis]|uniref:Phage integrase SAM-like domain-containing protein n=1 Tax=Kaistella carnis TaxID=1241979 RepID=A0A3G8XL84_9FLAO|nr:phage integrase SAM-like domain-containing protein [Kaistella carnis]AZI33962.1 hypothetical protein EIB73_12535 [Kaistella carnis]
MATIKFSLRKNEGRDSTIYFRYRPTTNLDAKLKTPYSINPEYWDDKNGGVRSDAIKPKTKILDQKKINKLLLETQIALSNFRTDFSTFIQSNPQATKKEIKEFIEQTYFPHSTPQAKNTSAVPDKFSEFVDFYIKEKSRTIAGMQNSITDATRKKLKTIKNKVEAFNRKLTITDIDDRFRERFADWMHENKFSASTIIKDLKYIKTLCVYAHKKKLEINSDVLHWEFIKPEMKSTPPVLSMQEIQKIQSIELTNDYLDNARDWLIIGCYTGARVSDLLNFRSENIIDGNLLKYRQKKIANQTTDSEEIIFLFPEVIKILNKRAGNFPRKISDQKFNEYIKQVCKLAGINKKMIGGIKDKSEGKHGKKITKEFEKWELVTSHICRRSFVTNFIEVLGKDVKIQTGHRTDEMVKLYDKTEKMEKALRVKEKIETHLKAV